VTPLPALGKSLLFLGAFLMVLGGLFLLGPKVPWLGRLPGDVLIERKNVQIILPLGTCLLLSLLLTLLVRFFGRR